jgi:hypothetical protein
MRTWLNLANNTVAWRETGFYQRRFRRATIKNPIAASQPNIMLDGSGMIDKIWLR